MQVTSTDAQGRTVVAHYGWLTPRTAVIEMSAASGLSVVSDMPLRPRTATTFGVCVCVCVCCVCVFYMLLSACVRVRVLRACVVYVCVCTCVVYVCVCTCVYVRVLRLCST